MSAPGPGGGAIAAAAADNLTLHMTWVHGRVDGMRAEVDAALAVADSGLATDTFNTVCRSRLDRAAPARIRHAIAGFGGRPFAWWVGPADEPADLPALLADAGLAAAGSEVAMWVGLDALAPATLPPGDFSIRRVRAPDDVRAFARINAANWSPPDAGVVAFYDRAAHVLLHADCPLACFLGILGDEPVATAEVTLSGQTAGLYNVSTLAAHRRKGIGMAMTVGPLLDARAAGARLGILQASSDGAGVYARAGSVPFGTYTEHKPPADDAGDGAAGDDARSR